MDKSEKRFERDIEAFLISLRRAGYVQFNGQDADGNWVHNRQHNVEKCIYMDVLCEFIAKTQPKRMGKYTRYYGEKAEEKLYHRLETTIANQGLLFVLRNGIEDKGCKLRVCYFKPESGLNPEAVERYEANILGCTRQFRYSTANTNTIDMVLGKRHPCGGAGAEKTSLRGRTALRHESVQERPQLQGVCIPPESPLSGLFRR